MLLKFCAIENPQDWMQCLSEQFGQEIVEDQFHIPSHLGEGFFGQYYLSSWLTLTYIRMKMYEPVVLERHAVEQSPWIPVMFYANEFLHQQVVAKQTKAVGLESLDGIFMPSCHISSRWELLPGQSSTNITLTFHRERLLQHLSCGKESFFDALLSGDESFYIFETISPEMLWSIDHIRKIVEEKPFLRDLHLIARAVELLRLFLEKLEKRPSRIGAGSINTNDVETVFRIRRLILANLDKLPAIPALARAAMMSPSKLQRCFKGVIGKTIADFALSEKMEWAKRLLATGSYSVSEVGYRVGYSNLSHFTEAFRKHHKINPKQYLLSL